MILQWPMRTVTAAVDGDVLTVLARADSEFTALMIAARTDRSVNAVRASLARLVEQGVVDFTRISDRGYLFSLNREHLAAPHIQALSELAATLFERMNGRIRTWADLPAFAAVYGSGARGEMRPDSDIDMIFIKPDAAGTEFDDDVHDLARDVSRWTGNDGRPVILLESEVATGGGNDGLVERVLEEGIPIHGDRARLLQLVGRRA